MRPGALFIKSVLLLGFFFFPSMAWGNSLLSFPAPRLFDGIKALAVTPINFTNMESVKLTSQALQTSMRTQLKQAGLLVISEENLENGAFPTERPLGEIGILTATVRRWESSGPLGSTMNSFVISLRFFQRARVQPSQREAWVVTWLETKSVLVGLHRPKGIEKALEELVQVFIHEFKK